MEECPFNYAAKERKYLYVFIKTTNKLKHILHSFNIVQCLLVFFYILKHYNDSIGILIWTIYILLIWTCVMVSLIL